MKINRVGAVIFGLSLVLTLVALSTIAGKAVQRQAPRSFLGGGKGATAMMPLGMPFEGEMAQEPMMADSKARGMMPPTIAGGAPSEDRERIGPKIIKTGSLTMRVDRVDARLEAIKAEAADAGGFVAESRVTDRDGVKSGFITLRIPGAKFDAVVSAIKRQAAVVLDESSNAEDVTAQYVDLDARLRAAKAEEAQYLEILKKARNVEETLNVTAPLGQVRVRIEQFEGELRYMRDRTEYATLNVTLTEETRVEIPTRTWKPLETLRQSVRGLVIALQQLADVLITTLVFLIGYLLPLLLVIGLIAWIIRAGWRRFVRANRRR